MNKALNKLHKFLIGKKTTFKTMYRSSVQISHHTVYQDCIYKRGQKSLR